jgi:hypothetical protein
MKDQRQNRGWASGDPSAIDWPRFILLGNPFNG